MVHNFVLENMGCMKSCKAGCISYQAIEAARRIISKEF
jgi:hypothetical protein